MKISVLDASTLGEDLDLGPLGELGDVKIFQTTGPCELEAHAMDADVLVLNKVKINHETLPTPGKVKLICIAATGFDNVSTDYCRTHGIALCNVSGYSANSVAQLTVAMALRLICHMPEYTDFVKSGRYTKSGIQNRLVPPFAELSGKKWGLVGCGGIGSAVARIAEAFGCEVYVFKRTPHPIYKNTDLDTLMKECDIISVHTPLDDNTKNMIDRQRIFSMKKTAVLINVARGAVCDEAALCEAIQKEAIGGIGVDVYSTEPFGPEHPYNDIMHRDNVCLTPHMAWGAYESRKRCLDEIILNIKAFFQGEIRNRIV